MDSDPEAGSGKHITGHAVPTSTHKIVAVAEAEGAKNLATPDL